MMLAEWVAGVIVQSEVLDGPVVKGETHLTTRLLSSFVSVRVEEQISLRGFLGEHTEVLYPRI